RMPPRHISEPRNSQKPRPCCKHGRRHGDTRNRRLVPAGKRSTPLPIPGLSAAIAKTLPDLRSVQARTPLLTRDPLPFVPGAVVHPAPLLQGPDYRSILTRPGPRSEASEVPYRASYASVTMFANRLHSMGLTPTSPKSLVSPGLTASLPCAAPPSR